MRSRASMVVAGLVVLGALAPGLPTALATGPDDQPVGPGLEVPVDQVGPFDRMDPGRSTYEMPTPVVEPRQVDDVAAVESVVELSAETTVVAGMPISLRALDVAGVGVSVRVRTLPADEVAALGGEVLAFTVTALGDTGDGLAVGVDVDYSGFRYALGGDWAQRLQLVSVPCAGQPAEEIPAPPDGEDPVDPCRLVPAEGLVNDFESGHLTAEMVLEAGGGVRAFGRSRRQFTGDGSTLALAGVAGSFNATSLVGQGSWQVGGNSGAFTYSYPIVTPPAFNGLGPSVSLDYSTGSVDGLTSSVNSQVGSVGAGWSLSTGAGFIERRYLPCTDSRIGGGTGDRCWYVQNATISLNGHASELVPINGTTGTDTSFTEFRLKDDPDWLVVRVPGGTNWWTNEYWKVITPDGMTFYFGVNDESQDSVSRTPLRGLTSGMPCYSLSNHLCTDMPYRWNLDRVEDAYGNRMIYKYAQQKNQYKTLGTTDTTYDMEALLTEILYGKAPAGGSNGSTPALGYTDRVLFDYIGRCTDSLTSATDSCPDFATANGTHWPDVPTNLYCPSGHGWTCTPKLEPTFFQTKRLSRIRTYTGTTSSWTEASRYFLGASMPDPGDGTNEKLWFWYLSRLSSADDGLTPGLLFEGTAKANRKDYGGSVPPMNMFRINRITDEMGVETAVTYQSNTCSTPYDWSTNTTDCFPMYASFAGVGSGWGIYRRWVVDTVTSRDLVTGPSGTSGTGVAPVETWDYTYSGAAWHHDPTDWWADTPGVDDVSWGQWRGYRSVIVTHGVSGTKSVNKTIYYQGMHGDKAAPSGTKTVTLSKTWTTSSEGVSTVYDEDWLAGTVFESFVMDGTSSTDYLSSTRNQTTWTATQNGVVVKSGWATPTTFKWRTTLQYSRLRNGGTGSTSYKDVRTDTSVDSYGRTLFVNSSGFLDVSGDDRCESFAYMNSTQPPSTAWGANWMNIVVQHATFAASGTLPTHPTTNGSGNGGSCGSSSNPPIAVTRAFFNYSAYNTTTEANNPTGQWWGATFTPRPTATLTRINNPTTGETDPLSKWQVSRTVYDDAGRVYQTIDPNGNTTMMGFNTTWGYPTQATYPITSLVTNVTVDPATGQPLTQTDQNSHATNFCYDNLGRTTYVFLPGASGSCTTPGTLSSYQFTYDIGAYDGSRLSKTPAIVVSSVLQNTTGTVRIDNAAYIDGHGRTRETQSYSPASGKIIVSAALTDDRGNATLTVEPFAISDAAPGNRTSPPSNGSNGFATWPNLPTSPLLNTDVTVFDTANRVTSAVRKYDTTTLVTTNTEYLGLKTVTKPQIGSYGATTVDVFGRPTTVETYNGTSAPSAGSVTNGGGIVSYSYPIDTTVGGAAFGWQFTVITDDGGNTLKNYPQNLLGQVPYETDLHTGVSGYSYDANGNVTRVDDGRSTDPVYTSYDALNRPTLRWTNASGAAPASDSEKLASWTYDGTNADSTTQYGLLTSETSWKNSQQYTTVIRQYDQRNQPTKTKVVIPGTFGSTSFAGEWRFQATYNDAGQMLTQSYPEAPVASAGDSDPAVETVTTHYNGLGVPDTLTGSGGSNAYVTGTLFDDLGRITQRDLRQGSSSTEATFVRVYWYNSQTRALDAIHGGWWSSSGGWMPFQHDQIARDAVGNITEIIDYGKEATAGNPSTDTHECFLYDNWNRLVRAHTATIATSCLTTTGATSVASGSRGVDPYDQVFTYDDLNRTNQWLDKLTGTASDYTYATSGKPYAVSSITNASRSYTYDGSGNTLTRNSDTLTYDNQGRLDTYNTTAEKYIYTTTNQRLIRETSAGVKTLYLPGMEVTTNGTTRTITGFRSIGGTVVATRTFNGSASVAWNCGNQQNSTTCQAPAAIGNLTPPLPARKRYLPYGGDRNTTTITNTDHRFLGQPQDTTSLTYLNNRYYDPTNGQFISVDPLVAKTGQPYQYGAASPTAHSDPDGLDPLHLQDTVTCNDTGLNLCGGKPGGSSCGEACRGTAPVAKNSQQLMAIWMQDWEGTEFKRTRFMAVVGETRDLSGIKASTATPEQTQRWLDDPEALREIFAVRRQWAEDLEFLFSAGALLGGIPTSPVAYWDDAAKAELAAGPGAHTINVHAAKDLSFLVGRQKNLASTFVTMEDAVLLTRANLASSGIDVANWLVYGKSTAKAFTTNFRTPTGMVLTKGAAQAGMGYSVTTVLVRDPTFAQGYYVLTSYPGL